MQGPNVDSARLQALSPFCFPPYGEKSPHSHDVFQSTCDKRIDFGNCGDRQWLYAQRSE